MSLSTRTLNLCQPNPSKNWIWCDIYESNKYDPKRRYCRSMQAFTHWNGNTYTELHPIFKAIRIVELIVFHNPNIVIPTQHYQGCTDKINRTTSREINNDTNDKARSATNKNNNTSNETGITNRLLKSVQSMIAAASGLMGKIIRVFKVFKLTDSVTLGSMVLTITVKTMYHGFPRAVGELVLVFIHEMGHAIVMYQREIPFHPIVFLPFRGAFISQKKRSRDAWEQALVSAGGPVLGSAGAAIVAIAAHIKRSPFLYALADFGFEMNLYNLLPFGILDGGRIVGVLSKWIKVCCNGLGSFLAYRTGDQDLFLMILPDSHELFQRFQNPSHLPPKYYEITKLQRIKITTGYIGLIAALISAIYANHKYQRLP